MAEKNLEADRYFDEILPVSFGSEHVDEAYEIREDKWYLIVYEDGKEKFWNSNKITLDSGVMMQKEFPVYYKFGDDFYVLFNNDSGAYLAYRIANDGALNSSLEDFYPELKKFNLVEESEDSVLPLKMLNFYYQPTESGKDWAFVMLLFGVLLVLFFYYLRKKRAGLAAITAFVLVIIDIGFYPLLKSLDLETFILYQPGIYASSDILGSLGLLINHILASIPLIFLLRFLRREYEWPIFFRVLLYALVFFAVDLTAGVAEGLILDSTISFNFEEFYAISKFSLIAVVIIGLLGIGVCFLINASRMTQDFKTTGGRLGIAIAATAFILFQMFDADRTLLILLLYVLFTLVVVAVIAWVQSQRIKLVLIYVLVVIAGSWIISKADQKREYNYISLYASKLVANQDLRTEYILKSFEDRLAEEFLKPEDYDNFSIRKDLVENRIKRLYFSNYLEKYELRLISFDSQGTNINDNKLYSFEKLDSIYNFNTKRTVSNYFYQVNKPDKFNGYLAKYENCDINGHYGTTFILLQPRVIQSEFLYPEVFANQRKKELVNLDDYSYGIYFNRELISQKGSYEYSLNLDHDWHSACVGDEEHKHYHFADIDQFDVILSKDDKTWKSSISIITFTFICLLPLCALLLLFTVLYFGRDNLIVQKLIDFKGRLLSTRIQFSLSIVLLVGLLMSVYIIFIYIRTNYNTSLENKLLVTIKNISTQFQNSIDLEQKLYDEEQRQLILNEESSAFRVDINIYDQFGRLLSTTKPYLVQEEIMGDLMNPRAYTAMNRDRYSQLLLQEELEGSDYLSAYVPLFNGRNEVIGYLNTPYFAKNEELNKQISTVLINVINIYFLLMVGGLILALVWSNRISKPLLLIREKFAQTELGSKNELIVYQRDDEIGQLVKQYNKMVLELEESASKLAEQEREGAWREMAKQVAHEIKNPLTPMKLSIQHLQRAFSSGRDIEPLLKKTSQLLIDQIDSLSRMASEFSNFAKMPEQQLEVFDLGEAIESIVNLYERTENVKLSAKIIKGCKVHADQEQIKRVFNNLLKNAVQAIPEDREGALKVKMSLAKNMVKVVVEDNGKGIPAEFKQKVFVPNFSTKNSGMGLGLAISRKIIESAGGKISFTSKEGLGTSFEVILPLYHED
ncbi:GHKL domain-containing protein [bacterium]|nr:GHKL domain-containing protein [bacterium]